MIQVLKNWFFVPKTGLEVISCELIDRLNKSQGDDYLLNLKTFLGDNFNTKERIEYLIWFTHNFLDIKNDRKVLRTYSPKQTVFGMAIDAVEPLVKNREYHNLNHVYDVIRNVSLLLLVQNSTRNIFHCLNLVDGNKLNVSSLFLAAIFHDVFYSYSLKVGDNETISSRIFDSWYHENIIQSSSFPYEISYIEMLDVSFLTSEFIIATIPDKRQVRYNTTDVDILSCLFCDADVMSSFLSRELAFNHAQKIQTEIKSYKGTTVEINDCLDYFFNKFAPSGFISLVGIKFQGNYMKTKREVLGK